MLAKDLKPLLWLKKGFRGNHDEETVCAGHHLAG